MCLRSALPGDLVVTCGLGLGSGQLRSMFQVLATSFPGGGRASSSQTSVPWLGGGDDTQGVEPEVMEDIARDLRLRTGEVSLLGLDDFDDDAPVVGRLRNNMVVACAVV